MLICHQSVTVVHGHTTYRCALQKQKENSAGSGCLQHDGNGNAFKHLLVAVVTRDMSFVPFKASFVGRANFS